MKPNFLEAVKAYAAHLQSQTGTQAVIMPSLLKSEKFHVELNLLPHPVIVGNGRIRLRLLANFFDQAEGFTVREQTNEGQAVYGMAYHTSLREDDDLFSDLQETEERSFSYNESWLVELEINSDDFI